MSTAIDLDRFRRGACPTLAAPMLTGDGYLSRVALTAPATPVALIALCEAAIRHGNGVIDISARGNLQARGLTEESAARFEAEVRRLSLPLRDGIAIDTGPLAGLDATEVADPRPLAEAIRKGAADCGLAAQLAAKTAVVVDGGGVAPLSGLIADIRLKAVSDGWVLFTGGAEQTDAAHGLLNDADAALAALLLLTRMADRGHLFRGRDFSRDEVRAVIGGRLLPASTFETRGDDPKPFGLFPLKERLFALGIAPAFGQIAARDLIAFLARAEAEGIILIRPAPGHALMLIGSQTTCTTIAAAAREEGFITRPNDPRASVAACPGSPLCASAHFDARHVAEEAAGFPDLLDGSFTLHVSGCAKGCAHPEPAAVTLSGRPEGVHLIFDGKASDGATAPLSSIAALAALMARHRREGESAAQCLSRLGPAGVAAFLTEGNP